MDVTSSRSRSRTHMSRLRAVEWSYLAPNFSFISRCTDIWIYAWSTNRVDSSCKALWVIIIILVDNNSTIAVLFIVIINYLLSLSEYLNIWILLIIKSRCSYRGFYDFYIILFVFNRFKHFLKRLFFKKIDREENKDGHVVLILEKHANFSLDFCRVCYTRVSSGDIVCVLPLH